MQTTTTPLIIAHHAVTAATLRAVLADWLTEAREEAARAACLRDAAAVRYAADRLRTVSRARDAVQAAVVAGRTLIVETRDGGLLVSGNGGDYLVSRAGLALSCDCPHGRKLAASEAVRGVCYHSTLCEAFAESVERQVAQRDADAEQDADADLEFAGLFLVDPPAGGDWLAAEHAAAELNYGAPARRRAA